MIMPESIYKYLILWIILCLLTLGLISCKLSSSYESSSLATFFTDKKTIGDEHQDDLGIRIKPLLLTRIQNLEHLKTLMTIEYDRDYTNLDSAQCINSLVELCYKSNGLQIRRSMSSGISQQDLMNIAVSDEFTKCKFVLFNPTAIRMRRELEKVYMLARRKADVFGAGDVAFYDLTEASLRNINTHELAFKTIRDSLEKGYINTFNHITAQAIITSFFSENLADLISDLHERMNMPELTTGKFTEAQLKDSLNNPMDNYVDIINNEIGQQLGLRLKEKYKINERTVCTPYLLADYLNDVQSYYMWSMQIGMDKFRPTDELIKKFSRKLNRILQEF
jgi:hypothetical protein